MFFFTSLCLCAFVRFYFERNKQHGLRELSAGKPVMTGKISSLSIFRARLCARDLSLRNYGRTGERPRAAHKVDVAEQGNL